MLDLPGGAIVIYIVELSRPIGNPNKRHGTAQYYIGYCEEHRLTERMFEHQSGRGAAMLRAAVRKGIQLSVVMTMPGSRDDERRLKKQKNTPRIVAKYRQSQLGVMF